MSEMDDNTFDIVILVQFLNKFCLQKIFLITNKKFFVFNILQNIHLKFILCKDVEKFVTITLTEDEDEKNNSGIIEGNTIKCFVLVVFTCFELSKPAHVKDICLGINTPNDYWNNLQIDVI